MMPITLQGPLQLRYHSLSLLHGSAHLIWLTTGVSAIRRACCAIGIEASIREAPNARYVSTLSLFSWTSLNMDVKATTIPDIVEPASIPTIGTAVEVVLTE